MSFTPSFRTARWIRTTNLVLQAALFLSFFAMLNYIVLHIGGGRFGRFDLTRLRTNSLSAETQAHLQSLRQPVRIYVTLSPKLERQYEHVRTLLQEYVYATEAREDGRVQVEYIDVDRDPRRVRELQLDLERNSTTVAVVESGEAPRQRRRIIANEDIYRRDRGDADQKASESWSFIGERAFTAAILDVTGNERKKIYFLLSHGEMELTDSHPQRGLSELRQQLEFRNYELDTLNFATAREVPEDASLLVCAGPRTRFTEFECELLRKYMTSRDGHFLFLAGPNPAEKTGLEELWHDWGVIMEQAVIADSSPENQRPNGDLQFTHKYDHPVTRTMEDKLTFGQTTIFRVNPSRARDEGLVITPLIVTDSKSAWGERNLRDLPRRYNPGQDIPPNKQLLVAAIASERVSAKKNLPFSVHGGRLVAFGSSDFVGNNRLGLGSNETIVLSAINWLVARDAGVNVPPRQMEQFQLSLTESQQTRLQYSLLVGLPGAVALIGLIVYWTRRR